MSEITEIEAVDNQGAAGKLDLELEGKIALLHNVVRSSQERSSRYEELRTMLKVADGMPKAIQMVWIAYIEVRMRHLGEQGDRDRQTLETVKAALADEAAIAEAEAADAL